MSGVNVSCNVGPNMGNNSKGNVDDNDVNPQGPAPRGNIAASQGMGVIQSFLPYMVILSLPNLNRLINDPLHHNPNWLPMPTKFPSNIPNFEVNSREDPTNHVCLFHMWCSSNSIT